MRLRVSGDHTDNDYDLRAVMGEIGARAGVKQGELMNAFVEAVLDRDRPAIEAARAAIVEELGAAAMVDAAAVIAAFNAYPRIADATGIPLEDAKEAMTAGMRAELGIDALA